MNKEFDIIVMIADYALSNLKFKKVIDVEGSVYGSVSDVLLHRENLLLKGLIITGSKMEEMLERFHLKKDKDPLLYLSQIEKITKEAIFLKVEISSLMQTAELSPANYIRFSELSKIDILDMNGNVVGRFIDLIFDDLGLNYQLGGDVFDKLVERNHSSTFLNYCITPREIHVTHYDYRIKISILEMEEQIKFGLDHLPRDMKVLANANGVVSTDEEAIIYTLMDKLPQYFKSRSAITEPWNYDELDTEKEEIMQALIQTAKQDHVISAEESAMLKKFAAHFFSPKKIDYYMKLV